MRIWRPTALYYPPTAAYFPNLNREEKRGEKAHKEQKQKIQNRENRAFLRNQKIKIGNEAFRRVMLTTERRKPHKR